MYSSGNNGFLIRDAVENQDAEQQFHSREKGSNAPQLVLQLGPGAPPPPPPPPPGPDTTPPDTNLTDQPSASTTATSATFTFTGSDNVTSSGSLTFQCQLDVPETGAWTACTSPRNIAGPWPSARTSSACAPSTPPETPIRARRLLVDDRPDGARDGHHAGPDRVDDVHERDLPLHVAGDGRDVRMQARHGAVHGVRLPVNLTNVSLGQHTFQVRASDAAGNLDTTPAS